MKELSAFYGITNQFPTSYFPSQNAAEIFIKTVEKIIKIARHNMNSEVEALCDALISYHQTPHPVAGIPLANMLFRDSKKTSQRNHRQTMAFIRF